MNRIEQNRLHSIRMTGEGNPSWSGKQAAIICKQCGKMFYKLPCEVQYRTKICSKECANKYYVGENHPAYGKERNKYAQIEYNCEYCGELNSVYKSRYNQVEHHFCDKKCNTAWIKLQVSKQDKEILKGRHCHSIRKWRQLCKERDNEECQICNSDMDLRVHHLNSFTKYPELQFTLDNGVTLCECCHRAFHSEYGIKNFTKDNYLEYSSRGKI